MNLIKNTLEKPLLPVVTIIGVILLAQAPHFVERYTVISLINILMFVILTLSWTIFCGPTHYISLASAAFFGCGVYVTAVVGQDLPLPFAVGLGGLMSFVLALLIGLLTLRLRGVYFILFTFGVSVLIRHSLVWWEAHVENTVGRYVFGGPNNETIYYYILAVFALTLLTAHVVRQSKLGLALNGIGENEQAAAHIGIDVTMVKVLSFAISAVFMGATGAIMANRWTYIDPVIAFNPLISFLPVLMAIFGGTSRLYGPVLGAAVFTILREYLITEYPYYYMLLMGAILIVVILYLPSGWLSLIDKAFYQLNRSARIRQIFALLQGES